MLTALVLTLLWPIGAATAASAAPHPPATPTQGAPKAPQTPAVTSPTDVTWGVFPSTAKGPDKRAQFTYTLDAGATVHDYVGVANYSAKPATFHVYTNDAVTTPQGGFGLLAADQRPSDVGAWVTLAQQTITVPAHARANIPFTLVIPQNATPGDHGAGIVAALQQPGQQGQIKVERRVGSRVYLRVKGLLAPRLAVTDLTADYHDNLDPLGGGDVDVSYTVSNTGNVRLGSAQRVTAESFFGSGLAHATPPTIPDLLPGGAVRVHSVLHGAAPLGPMTVDVKITPKPAEGALPEAEPLGTVQRSASTWGLPWPQLTALAVVAALIWLLERERRRRRRRLLAQAVAQARQEVERAGTAGAEPGAEAAPAAGRTTTNRTAQPDTTGGAMTPTAPGPHDPRTAVPARDDRRPYRPAAGAALLLATAVTGLSATFLASPASATTPADENTGKVTVTVTVPEATGDSGGSSSDGHGGSLAATGTNALLYVEAAALLLGTGSALTVGARYTARHRGTLRAAHVPLTP